MSTRNVLLPAEGIKPISSSPPGGERNSKPVTSALGIAVPCVTHQKTSRRIIEPMYGSLMNDRRTWSVCVRSATQITRLKVLACLRLEHRTLARTIPVRGVTSGTPIGFLGLTRHPGVLTTVTGVGRELHQCFLRFSRWSSDSSSANRVLICWKSWELRC